MFQLPCKPLVVSSALVDVIRVIASKVLFQWNNENKNFSEGGKFIGSFVGWKKRLGWPMKVMHDSENSLVRSVQRFTLFILRKLWVFHSDLNISLSLATPLLCNPNSTSPIWKRTSSEWWLVSGCRGDGVALRRCGRFK